MPFLQANLHQIVQLRPKFTHQFSKTNNKKGGTLAQNVPRHWIILRLKIRFISLLFCLGAQVQVGFDDAKPHRAGFFRVELGADHAALLGSGAHLAAAIHGIG